MTNSNRGHRAVSYWVASAVVFWWVSSVTYHAQTQELSGTLALMGGRAIAEPDASPIDNATVLIEKGRVTAVGTASSVTIPKGATLIDCQGLVIVAGFQNSHVHFTEEKWADAVTQPASKLTAQLQSMLTRYGFTTAVDAASLLKNTLAVRRRIEAGDVAGPRIDRRPRVVSSGWDPVLPQGGCSKRGAQVIATTGDGRTGDRDCTGESGRRRRYRQALYRILGVSTAGRDDAGGSGVCGCHRSTPATQTRLRSPLQPRGPRSSAQCARRCPRARG